jgi:endonuclease YncB( thermonuclease family)
MKKIMVLLLLLWSLTPAIAANNYVYGKILKVSDVNEVVIKGSYLQHQGDFRIMLHGLKAPEDVAMRQQSSEFLKDLSSGLPVRASLIKKENDEKGDVYVARLYVKQNNKWHRVEPDLVREGMASVDEGATNTNYLAIMEEKARKAKKGLWATQVVTGKAKLAER